MFELLGFVFFGGVAFVLGVALGFFVAKSLLRFYVLFVAGGLVVVGLFVIAVFASSTDPGGCGECTKVFGRWIDGLFVAGLALNLLAWLFGLILGGFVSFLLRPAEESSAQEGGEHGID